VVNVFALALTGDEMGVWRCQERCHSSDIGGLSCSDLRDFKELKKNHSDYFEWPNYLFSAPV
jgi:hypothetical protein